MKFNHQINPVNQVMVRRIRDCFAAFAMTALFAISNDGAFELSSAGAIGTDKYLMGQVINTAAVNK